MTIYRDITAQNSRALKPNEVYITQREKIKDFHGLAEFTFRRRSRLWISRWRMKAEMDNPASSALWVIAAHSLSLAMMHRR